MRAYCIKCKVKMTKKIRLMGDRTDYFFTCPVCGYEVRVED